MARRIKSPEPQFETEAVKLTAEVIERTVNEEQAAIEANQAAPDAEVKVTPQAAPEASPPVADAPAPAVPAAPPATLKWYEVTEDRTFRAQAGAITTYKAGRRVSEHNDIAYLKAVGVKLREV